MPGGAEPSTLGNPQVAKVDIFTQLDFLDLSHMLAESSVSHGVRAHAQLPAVDLKSTPLTTRADSHVPASNRSSKLAFGRSSCPNSVPCTSASVSLNPLGPVFALAFFLVFSPAWCWPPQKHKTEKTAKGLPL